MGTKGISSCMAVCSDVLHSGMEAVRVELILQSDLPQSSAMLTAESFVSTVVAHSSSQSDLNHLLSSLKAQVPSITGRQHLALQNQVLNGLDSSQHSLGILFILCVRGRVAHHCVRLVSDPISPYREAQTRSGLNVPDHGFLECTGRFLQVCSAAQIRMAPETSEIHAWRASHSSMHSITSDTASFNACHAYGTALVNACLALAAQRSICATSTRSTSCPPAAPGWGSPR